MKSNELWFGSTAQMNDTAECNHFIDAVLNQSSQLLGDIELPGLELIIEQLRPAIRDDTYISSWCEYFDVDPDGKLSMWRGYADDGEGVGLVIDSSQLQPSEITPQKVGFFVYSSKVEYVREKRVIDLANDYIRRLTTVADINATLMENLNMAITLLAKAPCVKHDGFKEEEEVRFLYMRGMRKILGSSRTDEIIKRVGSGKDSRTFYAFPLLNYTEFDYDLRLSSLLKKIVIGPAKNQEVRANKIRQLLNHYNLHHVTVEMSNIPYR